jgi:hypothetical protein
LEMSPVAIPELPGNILRSLMVKNDKISAVVTMICIWWL